MAKTCFFWATAAATVALSCFACPRARARTADETNGVLKKHGLTIVGSLAVLSEEAEIKTKLSEARRLSKQLSYSLTQQKGTLSPAELQQMQKKVTTEISQLRSEMTAVSQQMNTFPKYRGRFLNNDAAMLYSQLATYRMQLQNEMNQDSYYLNQLKSQPADPKSRERIDGEVRDRRDAYHQALLDLRKLVDSAHQKYAELGKNDEVKKALTALGKRQREKPKLGPSHDFVHTATLIDKLERAEPDHETSTGEGKPARHGRNSSKTKQTLKAAGALGDTAGSP